MRILICEDSTLLREGLVRVLEDAGHTVVAALPDADGLVDAVTDTAPELCILDVRLPPTFTDEGIRAALALRAQHPSLPVLVLSQYVEERYASDLITGQNAALGYLLKDRVADVRDFLDSIDRIASGATVLDPEVVAQLLTRRARDERMSRLTDRERSVLALIAEGKSNSAIAGALFVSEASVEKHITSLFQKLDLEQDEHGNRRVLAALVHLEHGGPGHTDQNGAVR
ncbi:response regulator transcription factor [Microbacterium sp. EYE_5]|uniref:LuxR C-terminal-related transcriptional regulator n=1 Tax=unclassified Microbacterium TaxID=2609290 RepID=UPI0020047317|nr:MULTISPECIES: response regulator transcription factor [unclassified Microbacterium]MCK6080072.1 response regulator transcription factor [Microbacterium sp. EYE_382]MCK6085343.1 response regulator transcription factor [Microbacterium sp. EYE_384]MCK6122432.1 response regulator transcription factor [Microbacterium sp. EYE_80]MCK6126106.1 response regulator transcription factor [Microbacterium sp. EYE_79]MCK6141027.1 response regulator transcription factor [Microbacterium sp. EYE_39]